MRGITDKLHREASALVSFRLHIPVAKNLDFLQIPTLSYENE
jgi:hypothetical protein